MEGLLFTLKGNTTVFVVDKIDLNLCIKHCVVVVKRNMLVCLKLFEVLNDNYRINSMVDAKVLKNGNKPRDVFLLRES